jgi:hypothetical protein
VLVCGGAAQQTLKEPRASKGYSKPCKHVLQIEMSRDASPGQARPNTGTVQLKETSQAATVRILSTGTATSGLTSLIAAERADGGLFAAQSFCGGHKGVLVSKQLSTTGGCHLRITSCRKRDRGTRSIATMELLRSSSISAQIKLALCGK